MECPFCRPGRIIDETDAAACLLDNFPVTPLHTLIVPKRHAESFFDLEERELAECLRLLYRARERLLAEDPAITGFNIGINIGTDAGQTIPHCHIHLIPRRRGDVARPEGGIRHVIPGKGRYGGDADCRNAP